MDLFGYEPPKPGPKTCGGINGPLTEARDAAAKILEISIARVGRMTKGWTAEQIHALNARARQGKNPGALWWTLYKKQKHYVLEQ